MFRVKNEVLVKDDWLTNNLVVNRMRRMPLSNGQRSFLAWLGLRLCGPRTYFLLDEEEGIIKIGTGNARSRIVTCQNRHPRQLTLLGLIDDSGWQEAAIHKELRSERVPYGDEKEWFRWSPRTQSLVERVLREGGVQS